MTDGMDVRSLVASGKVDAARSALEQMDAAALAALAGTLPTMRTGADVNVDAVVAALQSEARQAEKFTWQPGQVTVLLPGDPNYPKDV